VVAGERKGEDILKVRFSRDKVGSIGW
jgi:hypothetical protein